MGDDPDDDAAPTQSAPTEMGEIAETEAHTAWSLYDEDDELRHLRIPPWVLTALAIGVALVAIVGASALVGYHLRGDDAAPPPAASLPTSPAMSPPSPPSSAVAAPSAAPAPAPPPGPATVTISANAGSAWVRTRSGKTVCQVTAGDVGCNVHFTRGTPTFNGMPASGVSVTTRGVWQWIVGDPGDPDYDVLDYGTTYHTLGWTITPTSNDTTFLNDSTGHGMTISTEGFTPF